MADTPTTITLPYLAHALSRLAVSVAALRDEVRTLTAAVNRRDAETRTPELVP